MIFARMYNQKEDRKNVRTSSCIAIEKVECEDCFGVAELLYTRNASTSSLGGLLLGRVLKNTGLDVFGGPLFRSNFINENSLSCWIEKLLLLAEKLDASITRVVPPYHSLVSEEGRIDFKKYDEIFSQKGFSLFKSYSVVLDNSLNEDLAWKKLKSEARRKVRRGRKAEVFVREIQGERDLLAFMEAKGKKNAKALLEDVQEVFSVEESLKLYVAEKDGHPLAWQGVAWGEDVTTLGGNCVSQYARENSLYGNHVLQWFVIQEAIRRGVRWIDWVGADPEPKTQKQKNITEFKLLWGVREPTLIRGRTWRSQCTPSSEVAQKIRSRA